MKVSRFMFDNDLGGTEMSDRHDIQGTFDVKVTRTFYDYETGQRYVGRLVKPEDVERTRKAGTTEYAPKKAGWDPAVVYWHGSDIVPTGPAKEGPGPLAFTVFWGKGRVSAAKKAASAPGPGSAWWDTSEREVIGELLARFTQAGGPNADIVRAMLAGFEEWLDARTMQAEEDPEFGEFCKRARETIDTYRQYVTEA